MNKIVNDILKQIKSGLNGTGFRITGDIKIELEEDNKKVIFTITNQG